MNIESLDHLALWVEDRDELADFTTAHLGMHVIERTEKFTLVGADARRGKLTLFAAEGPREAGPLSCVALRVADMEAAVRALPQDLEVRQDSEGAVHFMGPQGLGFALVETGGADYDIDHVALKVPDPDASRPEFATLGFHEHHGRLRAGEQELRLEPGGTGTEPERPLLNHFGLLVSSAEDHLAEARERGIEIDDVVDGPNTFAVFIYGPDRIRLEYVEHKPSFSLV
jgi:catechol 2,3-dioxygenase-like lactoylglutathione lyase family enzyme